MHTPTADKFDVSLSEVRRRWLVTGAAGFIGSHLVEELLRQKQAVIGFDDLSTGSYKNLDEVRAIVGTENWKQFEFVMGDIGDFKACLKVMQGADYVLHQAGAGSVPRSLKDPKRYHDRNVTGFLNLLLAARDSGIRRVVYASSSSVYGSDETLPKVENRIGDCLSPYATTKRMNELYASVFARCYGLEPIGLRYFNVFGPRQNPQGPYAAVIPAWLASMVLRKPVRIHGDGESSRGFCYVANVVLANLVAATTRNLAATNQVYNVSTGGRITLNELFQMLREVLSQYCPHVAGCQPVYGHFRPGDMRHSEADIAKAKTLLGYQPSHTFLQGIQATVPWYYKLLRQKNDSSIY
jgi:UDP-N-acetylglucosamine 4-epimerase